MSLIGLGIFGIVWAIQIYRTNLILDSLLKEIGMAPGEISNIRNILGDYENPKKDFHMNFDKDPTKGTKGSK